MVRYKKRPQSRPNIIPGKIPAMSLMERTQAVKTASKARFKRYAPRDVKIWL